jgi:hypothetical protein
LPSLPLNAVPSRTPSPWPLLGLGLAATGLLCWAFLHQWPGFNGHAEWYWPYRPAGTVANAFAEPLARSLLRLLPGSIVLGGLALALRSRRARRRLHRRARRQYALALWLVWGLHYQWIGLTTLHAADPTILATGVLNPGATGFLSVAQQVNHDAFGPLDRVLTDYPILMNDWPAHASTHPPGLVLTHLAALHWSEDSPALTLAAERALAVLGVDLGELPAIPIAHKFTAMIIGMSLLAGSLLAGLPLFALVRAAAPRPSLGERRAWIALALWLHFPAAVLFTPSYDQAYPLLVLTALWMAWRAMRSRRPALWGVAAGAVAAAGAFLTFKLLIWLPLGVLAAYLASARRAGGWGPAAFGALWRRLSPRSRRAPVRFFCGALVALLAAYCTARLLFGIDLPAIYRVAAANHALLVDAARSYGVWIWAGPLDFLFFAGPILALPALAWTARAIRDAARSPRALEPLWAVFPLGVALVALSGLMPGENARLWLMFAPGLVWAAAAWLADRPRALPATALALILAVQHVFTLTCLHTMRFIFF